MRFHAAAAATLISSFALAWSSPGRADEVQRDLHDPSVSPESSSGINPGTTRQIDRGLPSRWTTIESAEARDPHVAYAPQGVSTTTTTGAAWDPAYGAVEGGGAGPNRSLLIGGAALFLGTYAASALTGAIVGTEEDEHLVVPLVGPWLALGERSCAWGECGFHGDVNIMGLVASGVAQAAGLGIALTSFFVSERRETPRARLDILPVGMGRAGAGLGASGTF